MDAKTIMPTATTYLHKSLFTGCLFFIGLAAHSQSAKTVKDLVKKHRQCFSQCLANHPTDRIQCSEHFYYQMDSLLNVVYRNTKTNLSKNRRRQLEREQVKWLHDRDTYFAEQDILFKEKHKKSDWRSDMEMITYEDKANFVKDRVVALLAYAAGGQ